MADPISLLKTVFEPLRAIRDAVKGAREIKDILRNRYADYESLLEPLKNSPEIIDDTGIARELEQLKKLFVRVADLLGVYTAAPEDGKLEKINKVTKRAASHSDVIDELDTIDGEVMRQLAIISLKGAINPKEMDILKGLDGQIREVSTSIQNLILLLPSMKGGVPAAAPAKPRVQMVSMNLTKMGQVSAPWLLLDVGGKGEARGNSASVAVLIAHHPIVQEHFFHVMWVNVGLGGKDRTRAILGQLASEVARLSSSTGTALDATPCTFDSTDEAVQCIAADDYIPRLVVLEDVRDHEVVDVLRGTGLQLLVCAESRSVATAQCGCTEVDDLTEEEMLNLQGKTIGNVDEAGADVYTISSKTPAVKGLAGLAPAYSVDKADHKSREVVGKIIGVVDDLPEVANDTTRTVEFTISNNSGQRLFIVGDYMESGKLGHFPRELKPGDSGPGYMKASAQVPGKDGVKGMLLYQWGNPREKIGFFVEATGDSEGEKKTMSKYFWDTNRKAFRWYFATLSEKATTRKNLSQVNDLVVMSCIQGGRKAGASFVVEI